MQAVYRHPRASFSIAKQGKAWPGDPGGKYIFLTVRYVPLRGSLFTWIPDIAHAALRILQFWNDGY